MTKLTKLPSAPKRSESATFTSLADLYLAALVNYQSELNVIASDITQAATYVATYLANHALYQSTSTSSYTFGNATATFVTQASEAYVVGSRVIAYSGTSYVVGDITSYSGTSLVLKVLLSNGSGSLATWSIATVYGPSAGGVVPTVASAATVDLTGLGGFVVQITGNTPTTALTLPTGVPVYAIASDGWKLVYSSTLIIEGLQDYTCNAGDRLTLLKSSGGTVNVLITRVSGLSVPTRNIRAIFGYGLNTGGSAVSMTNLVSAVGLIATDTTGVGTNRSGLAAAGYGTDKALFAYGYNAGYLSVSNKVSNQGVVATDTTGVGTARQELAAAGYGGDKAIFAYGYIGGALATSNLASNIGVISSDVTGVGTARWYPSAAGYSVDKAIFAYGFTGAVSSLSNLVSNLGVVATDTTGVGTARYGVAAASYGGDKAVFGYGIITVALSMTNLVSNVGVVATDTTGIGTARYSLAAAVYGGDKVIFGYGYDATSPTAVSNKVTNLGIVATDTTGIGTSRHELAASSYA